MALVFLAKVIKENSKDLIPIITIIITIITSNMIVESFFSRSRTPGESPAGEEDEVGIKIKTRKIQEITSKPPKKAARLPHFSQAWQQVTNNSLILNIVCNGYKIQFITEPFQSKFVPRNLSKKNPKICQKKVKEFLKFKIVKVVTPNHDQFLSHIFQSLKRV